LMENQSTALTEIVSTEDYLFPVVQYHPEKTAISPKG